jgi:hypothetical protein
MTESSLVAALLQVIQDFEEKTRAEVKAGHLKIEQLTQENLELRQEIDKELSIFDEVTDEMLQRHLARLTTSPLDTIIREAGVVLEDRLRQVGGEAVSGLHGVSLVDGVLAPEKGTLILSKHTGEQQGVHMLYRGAMQFIRNPPMHNIIEYQASTARILIRLIDTLLTLLAEAKIDKEDHVSINDIRRMLRRRKIPNAQINLYRSLYDVGDKGLTNGEIIEKLNCTRMQLAGVLGALGVRINRTTGLENKGGIQVIFDVSDHSNGDYIYRMRPILRKALELEKLLQ